MNCPTLLGKSFYELRTTNYELNYAKQTQFAKCPNKRKCCFNKDLRKKTAAQSPKNKPKQTQYKPNSNPIKPNYKKAKNDRK